MRVGVFLWGKGHPVLGTGDRKPDHFVLKEFGLGLKIFDAYRPQRAVDHFVTWAKDLSDTRMKSKYSPDVPKNHLFSKGYIADKSSRSRGSTVDLTLVETTPGESSRELDMGSGFDFFSPFS